MSDAERLSREKLVEVYQARTEWEGNLVVSYLRENGVEAVLQEPPAVPPLDSADSLTGTDRIDGVFVLEHNVERAASLVKEFVSAPPDDRAMEQAGTEERVIDPNTAAGRTESESGKEKA